MPVPNAYRELPEVPYKKTQVKMPDAITAIAGMSVPREVKRAAYILFRIESANGQSGFNFNFGGIQADGSRWPAQYDKVFNGTLVLNENGTKKPRRFLSFPSLAAFLGFLAGRLQARGLYVGGRTHKIIQMDVTTPAQLCRAYVCEWVTGDKNATPSQEKLSNFLSMYHQSEKLFPI